MTCSSILFPIPLARLLHMPWSASRLPIVAQQKGTHTTNNLRTQAWRSMKAELLRNVNRQLITKIRRRQTITLSQCCLSRVACVDQRRSEQIIPNILLHGHISVPRKGEAKVRLWSWRLNMSHPENIASYSS